jgi:hypothetical protein
MPPQAGAAYLARSRDGMGGSGPMAGAAGGACFFMPARVMSVAGHGCLPRVQAARGETSVDAVRDHPVAGLQMEPVPLGRGQAHLRPDVLRAGPGRGGPGRAVGNPAAGKPDSHAPALARRTAAVRTAGRGRGTGRSRRVPVVLYARKDPLFFLPSGEPGPGDDPVGRCQVSGSPPSMRSVTTVGDDVAGQPAPASSITVRTRVPGRTKSWSSASAFVCGLHDRAGGVPARRGVSLRVNARAVWSSPGTAESPARCHGRRRSGAATPRCRRGT